MTNLIDISDPIALHELASRFSLAATEEKEKRRLEEASNSLAIAAALRGRADRITAASARG